MKQNYHNNNNYKPSVHYKHAHTPLHITLTTLQKNNHVSEVHCGSFFWWVCVYARHLSLTKSTSTQKKKERTKRKGGKRRWKMRGKGGERRKARDIRKREGDGFRGVEGRGYRGGQGLILITLHRHECFSVFHHLQKNKQRKQRHSLKLGKKRREISKCNYYIIPSRVIIKAVIITNVYILDFIIGRHTWVLLSTPFLIYLMWVCDMNASCFLRPSCP